MNGADLPGMADPFFLRREGFPKTQKPITYVIGCAKICGAPAHRRGSEAFACSAGRTKAVTKGGGDVICLHSCSRGIELLHPCGERRSLLSENIICIKDAEVKRLNHFFKYS